MSSPTVCDAHPVHRALSDITFLLEEVRSIYQILERHGEILKRLNLQYCPCEFCQSFATQKLDDDFEMVTNEDD